MAEKKEVLDRRRTELSGKTVEEIRKRRGRSGGSPVNIYHKMLLLGTILSALLVIGISPKLAIWAIGGGLILGISLFLWSKGRRPKKNEEQQQVKELDVTDEVPPLTLEEIPAQEVEAEPAEEMTQPEEISLRDKQEEEEKIVEVQEIFADEREPKPAIEAVPAGTEDTLEERMQRLEARVLDLEVKLVQVEKLAGLQVVLPKPGEEVDLQAAFSNWEEKEGVKTA